MFEALFPKIPLRYGECGRTFDDLASFMEHICKD